MDANRLRLLFVADEIPNELERVVKFLNKQTRDNLEVLAVEVKQYPGQFGDALVSRVIGQVSEQRQRPSSAAVPSERERKILTYIQAASDALGGAPPVIAQAEMVAAIPMPLATLQRGLYVLKRSGELTIRETTQGRRGPRQYYLRGQVPTAL